jgi:hypothetical protein
MSKANDGKNIHCDGTGCVATGTLPVGLRKSSSLGGGGCHSSCGWLFIEKGEKSLHFCPACGQAYLAELKTKP